MRAEEFAGQLRLPEPAVAQQLLPRKRKSYTLPMIKVLFFASFRDRVGRHEDAIETSGTLTAAEVWARAAGAPVPQNTLVAVNLEYASLGHVVRDGDEVAFFPPVTGG